MGSFSFSGLGSLLAAMMMVTLLLLSRAEAQGVSPAYLTLEVFPFAFSSFCNEPFKQGNPFTPELGGHEQNHGCFADRFHLRNSADYAGRIIASNVFFGESSRGNSQDMINNGLSLMRNAKATTDEREGDKEAKDGFFNDLLGVVGVTQLTFEKAPDTTSPYIFQIMSQFGNNAIFEGNYSCINWPLALLQFELPVQRNSPNEKFLITVEGVLAGFKFEGRKSDATGLFEFVEKVTVDVSYLQLHYTSTSRNYGNTPSSVSNFLHFNSRYIDNLGGYTPFCGDVGVSLPLFRGLPEVAETRERSEY